MNILSRIRHIDKSILSYIFFLSFIGILAITSATRANITGDYGYVIKQIVFFLIGFIIMLIIALLDFNQFNDNFKLVSAIVLYIINLGALIFVLQAGTIAKGAERWIPILGFNFQPSEFGKVIMIFCFAVFMAKCGTNINKLWALALNIILLALPVFLIIIQPSLSTGIIFIAIFSSQIFVAKINYRYIIAGLILAAIALGILELDAMREKPIFLKEYQAKRILALFEPEKYQREEAYQTKKSVEAIGSGKFYGKGVFNGNLNKAEYLPEPHTDFIFSTIAEESGFLMSAIIIVVYFLLIFKLIYISSLLKDLFRKLLIVGVAGMIAFQVFINIGVVSGIIPNTGMPLPFISSGGSSLLTNMIAIGMVLNVDINRKNRYMLI